MTEKFLDDVYNLKSADETRALYDRWATSYDSEVGDNGYVTPGRVAQALWARTPTSDAPVLDYGCGTGLSGLALRLAGFKVIDGMDPSPEMLEGARAKDVYRDLIEIDIHDSHPVPQDAYRIITAIGVIGAGAAPPETLDLLMRALPSQGYLAFSFNDHTLADRGYEMRLNDWLDCGSAHLLSKDYGPHLTGKDMNSNVYVVQKA
ncbi:Methyltransferase domain-containing protein [Cribrihabitans marinus]|uniref:Methyltransferase domain-containing protein n=1 Tax=Cribrihabitans marinus TaxID=1227549 RepID=A0A1H6VPH6_9RHOB|nr:class I SAM-dependent methyltransferase [Cribrihabitans marinus]GGH25601.1 SAM-dependent methyltransferase [Cribrihabitans marinus]SEJ04964.1 Methyltransferase domain-containing protein [Cribrihabitans marinus]